MSAQPVLHPGASTDSADLRTPAAPRLMMISRGLALCAGAIGVVGLIGWHTGSGALKSVLSGAVDIKPNTALGLIAAALSLFLLSSNPTQFRRRVSFLLAISVALLGLATLCEFVFRWDLGIDELMFSDRSTIFNLHRGRMSPYSTVAFGTLGIALAALPRPSFRSVVIPAALVAACVGAVSLLGYLWSTPELTTDQWMPPVAVHAALAFILLGIGAIVAEHALVAAPKYTDAKLEGRVETEMLVGFIVALLLFCIGGGIAARMGVTLSQGSVQLAHDRRIREGLTDLSQSASDLESAQRRYIFLRELDARKQYAELAATIGTDLDALRKDVSTDPLQRIRLASIAREFAALEAILNSEIEVYDAQGENATRELIHADRENETLALLRDKLKLAETYEQEQITGRRTTQGSDRSLAQMALFVTLAFATATLVMLFRRIVRDVRSRAAMMRELEDAQRDAQRATRAKSDFLASMSHEIRTPMNGIIGTLEVLQQSSLMSAQTELVDLIRESADALLTIINDILDFSKIEAERLEVECFPLSVTEVVEKSADLLNRMADRSDVTLTVFVDPQIPAELLGDPGRIRQILINLINNAIKFSSRRAEPGRVAVRARLKERRGSSVIVEFCVSDNGPGIDDQTLVRIFTAFTQADASTTRRYGGTGLGLSICKQLTRLMGGDITCETVVGKGSTFTATVALESAQSIAVESARNSAAIEGLCCLVIGGGNSLADDLGTYLQADMATVTRVPDLEAARAWSEAHSAGLAVWVVDAGRASPPISELKAAIRARADLDLRVVLVVLGHGRRRHPRAHADGIVTVDGNALNRKTLSEAVAIAAGRTASKTEEHATKRAGQRIQLASRDGEVRERKMILVAEDNEINQKVIRQQLQLLGYTADVAANGREALEKWRHGDYMMLLTDLHMPEMDGYDLALAIRVAESGAFHLPIVAVTANALHGEADRCRAVGMDDYLCKPVPLAALAACIEKWGGYDRGAAAPDAGLPPLVGDSDPAAASPPLAVHVLESLVGTDPALIEEFLDDFRRSLEDHAKELNQAFLSREARHAAIIAHRLKSSARAVGAAKLGDLCAAIEAAAHAGKIAEMTLLLEDFSREVRAVKTFLEARSSISDATTVE